tara:strand:- start:338 stop:901 length:564 start_codon:yes stop_codon:yes gene_type:complete
MSQFEIIFVRHGEAESSFGIHQDPALSENGIAQSLKLIEHGGLQSLESFTFLSSPKLRAIETAKPIAKKFNKLIKIDETFIEIPSKNIEISKKQEWLKQIVETKKNQLPDNIKLWEKNIFKKIQSFQQNTIIFSHFMVINSIISTLSNSKNLLYFYPDYTSVTKIININGKLNYFLCEGNKKTFINL